MGKVGALNVERRTSKVGSFMKRNAEARRRGGAEVAEVAEVAERGGEGRGGMEDEGSRMKRGE
jgi:hypothetical protein